MVQILFTRLSNNNINTMFFLKKLQKRIVWKQLVFLVVFVLSYQSFAQETTQTLTVNGASRSMIVYVPSGLAQNRPLLISCHGSGQGPDYQRDQSKWNLVADTAKFLVVYPRGNASLQWDISGTTDTDFISAIIDAMYTKYGIDKSRVYLNGFSMGGMLTYHAALKIADKIAAFAPVSGYPLYNTTNFSASRTIPIIHTHGDVDNVVIYDQKLLDYLTGWRNKNKCPNTAVVTKPYPVGSTTSTATKSYWSNCDCGVEFTLLTIGGKGHWYSNDPLVVITSHEIWNFVKKYKNTCSAATVDCNNTVNGTATKDNCDRCVGGTTGKTACKSVGEAETDACSYDGILETTNAGFKGTSYVNINNGVGAKFSFNISASSAGTYIMSIRYANGSTNDRSATVTVNGVAQSSVLSFPTTGDFTTYKTVDFSIPLKSGNNTVELSATIAEGLSNIDQIGYVSSGISKGTCVITEVNDNVNILNIEVYPNPFDDFGIKVFANKEFKYKITDLSGVIISEGLGNKSIILGTTLKTGIYFLTIETDNDVFTKQILKK
ncbi:MAG: T9SS type A sorting domain-containing protein [Cytophagales bacterium]